MRPRTAHGLSPTRSGGGLGPTATRVVATQSRRDGSKCMRNQAALYSPRLCAIALGANHWSIPMTRNILLAVALTLSAGAFAKAATPPTTPHPVDMVSCKDGTKAQLPVKQGTCSGHGGVAAAKPTTPAAPPAAITPAAHAAPAPAPTPSAAAPAGATAKCKDGTYSMSKTHSGACSRHGGVANWL